MPLFLQAAGGAAGGGGGGARRKKGGVNAATVCTKFKTQLNSLMNTIAPTKVQYVRCIKPNKNKTCREVGGVAAAAVWWRGFA